MRFRGVFLLRALCHDEDDRVLGMQGGDERGKKGRPNELLLDRLIWWCARAGCVGSRKAHGNGATSVCPSPP